MSERYQETNNMLSDKSAPKQTRFIVTAASVHQRTIRSYVWRPPTDVYEAEDRFSVRVEIAGMQDAEFEISLQQRLLVIRGSRLPGEQQGSYQQMEIRFGEFISIVELSGPVDIEKTTAEYEDGFLWVILPKQKPATVRAEG